MSSFFGHASVGAALFLGQTRPVASRALPGLGLLVLLAILPDFDYFAFWLFGIDTEPRWTHSLLFALVASSLAWIGTRRAGPELAFPFWVLAAAACSHPVLDLLVGVHPVCVLWPLPLPQWQSPVGLLPSAGSMNVKNFYFWRNLVIETGVLVPAFALYVGMRSEVPWRRLGSIGVVLLPVWLWFVFWSVQIHA
jgi:inner membrane protein